MALTRKDDISPEEHLLRLIEKPAGIEQTPFQEDDVTIILDGKKKWLGYKTLVKSLVLLSVVLRRAFTNLSLKTVNKVCLIVITILLGYAIWNVVSAESIVIPKPEEKELKVDDMTGQEDITLYYTEIDKRDIFKDMYKPPAPAETTKPAVGPGETAQPPVPEAPPPPITDVLNNLKVIGITWEPEPGVVLITDKTSSYTHCLQPGDTFVTKIERSGIAKDALITIKEISKDKVMLQYENEEGTLTLAK